MQKISESQIDSEIARFYQGRNAAVEQLSAIRDRAAKTLGEEKSSNF